MSRTTGGKVRKGAKSQPASQTPNIGKTKQTPSHKIPLLINVLIVWHEVLFSSGLFLTNCSVKPITRFGRIQASVFWFSIDFEKIKFSPGSVTPRERFWKRRVWAHWKQDLDKYIFIATTFDIYKDSINPHDLSEPMAELQAESKQAIYLKI